LPPYRQMAPDMPAATTRIQDHRSLLEGGHSWILTPHDSAPVRRFMMDSNPTITSFYGWAYSNWALPPRSIARRCARSLESSMSKVPVSIQLFDDYILAVESERGMVVGGALWAYGIADNGAELPEAVRPLCRMHRTAPESPSRPGLLNG
jgi:hypothetical protein